MQSLLQRSGSRMSMSSDVMCKDFWGCPKYSSCKFTLHSQAMSSRDLCNLRNLQHACQAGQPDINAAEAAGCRSWQEHGAASSPSR